jgi:hypothetical protein
MTKKQTISIHDVENYSEMDKPKRLKESRDQVLF